ncbi:MAG TPA: tetraacyldisaccharide 4'-kinase [Acidimicrobiaceae bacterium]|nr:tetraacyldisaccharide 4'-kinase [Acidimicrobiaceae bacterium]HAZ33880.1 tetraacyldisaccharide 4'-kinase [Acidimicrobiaceae bacterium]
MSLDPQLLEILVCPEDKGALVYVESEGVLLNERLLRTYPVRDDIPVMLIDEASQVSDDEVQRLLAIAAG